MTVALEGQFQAGESVAVNVLLNPVDTSADDFASTLEAFQRAVNTQPDLDFDGVTLTYAAPFDGASMPDLAIGLPVIQDQSTEPAERFSVQLAVQPQTTGVASQMNADAGRVSSFINGSPSVVNDANLTLMNTTTSGNVLLNDSDPEGEPLRVSQVNGTAAGTAVTTANGGIVVIQPDGRYTYTPPVAYTGGRCGHPGNMRRGGQLCRQYARDRRASCLLYTSPSPRDS